MAELDEIYEKLDEENRRVFFPQRYYTERIAALEGRVAELQRLLDAQTPAARKGQAQPAKDDHKTPEPPPAEQVPADSAAPVDVGEAHA